jgi:uncharacterized protein YkwD
VPCFSYSEIKNYQITDIKKEGLNESQSFQERIPCKQKEKKAILKIQAELKKIEENPKAKEMISITNDFREKNGLPTLKENELLNLAAEKKAEDMFSKEYFSHLSPENITPWYWIKESGYSYKNAGENLAKGFSTPQKAFNALIKSPSHKKNILNKNYQDIGIAILSKKFGEEGEKTIIVQMFGLQNKKINKIKKSEFLSQDKIKVSIIVESEDQYINTIMAKLEYRTDELELIEVNNNNSKFSIFLQSKDDENGKINLIALQPFPGVKGNSNIIDLSFKPLKKGKTEIKILKDSKVLANDGYGTNVLKESNGLIIEI